MTPSKKTLWHKKLIKYWQRFWLIIALVGMALIMTIVEIFDIPRTIYRHLWKSFLEEWKSCAREDLG